MLGLHFVASIARGWRVGGLLVASFPVNEVVGWRCNGAIVPKVLTMDKGTIFNSLLPHWA